MPPEQRAEWRTRYYGNDGFDERQVAKPQKVIGVATGDSWFDYVPARLLSPGDVIDHLNAGTDFNIWRTSVAGDTVENMIWGTTYWSGSWNVQDTRQLPRAIDLIQLKDARFFLFSGGGDDIVGTPLSNYLNHVGSGMPPIRTSEFSFLINEYLRTCYVTMIEAIRAVKPTLPIIFHGYDYPVADGRGVLNGPWGFQFVAPSLRPAFAMKRFDAPTMESVLRAFIDTFNEMLSSLHNPGQNIHHLDLRNQLSSIYHGDYRNAWANELHPTDDGFRLIAELFATQIARAIA